MSAAVGVYVHVPFCGAKCHYCDFNSFAGLDRLRAPYVDAVSREIASFGAANNGIGDANGRVPLAARTINFGGGTPSLLQPDDVARVLSAIRGRFSVDSGIEISLEANPGTIAESRLAAFHALGVNRLSFGVQSFDDALLVRLGRIHDADQAASARLAARRAGFDNLNLDFIYGLPGQTLAIWRDTLVRAIDLCPEHISAYSLTVEEGTLFGTLRARGQLPLPDEDLVADMFDLAEELLAKAGYSQYEISNWALAERFRCQHNLGYWRNLEYLGFGPGAHSWYGGRRSVATLDPRRWVKAVIADGASIEESEAIDRDLELGETMMLGLRLTEGVDLISVGERFDRDVASDLAAPMTRSIELGLLWQSGDRIGLTLRGRRLGNEVFGLFLEAARTGAVPAGAAA
ncbi:MAG: radical SAM family heme chaperone HemW [Chloroflexota bacterium]|nr:MAG: radical SAM family heme chaperone HemW [Chloroflexota bacterium]